MAAEWIRFAVVALCFGAGMCALVLCLVGVFRLQDALNGLHAASILDSLVLLFFVVGCICAAGLRMVSLKYLMVLLLQWSTCPMTAHMLTKLEFMTNRGVERLMLHLKGDAQ